MSMDLYNSIYGAAQQSPASNDWLAREMARQQMNAYQNAAMAGLAQPKPNSNPEPNPVLLLLE